MSPPSVKLSAFSISASSAVGDALAVGDDDAFDADVDHPAPVGGSAPATRRIDDELLDLDGLEPQESRGICRSKQEQAIGQAREAIELLKEDVRVFGHLDRRPAPRNSSAWPRAMVIGVRN